MANNNRYIQFPLHLIDNIPERIEEIISYGIVRYARTFKYDNREVYRQVVYSYYHDTLTPSIKYAIQELIRNGQFDEDDYNGFDSEGLEFDPEENITSLIDEWGYDSEIFKECVLDYQIKQATDHKNLNVNISSSTVDHYHKLNRQVLSFENKHGRDALTGISIDMVFNYRDEEKSAYEIDLLKAFLAIKSLQGIAKLCETNKAAIIMRMTGSKNKEVLKEKSKTSVNKRLIEKYEKRHHIDKLLTDLRLNGFIQSKIPNNRSLFISTSLNDKELAKAAFELIKKKQQKTQKSIIKKQENEAKNLLNQLLQNA